MRDDVLMLMLLRLPTTQPPAFDVVLASMVLEFSIFGFNINFCGSQFIRSPATPVGIMKD
jgi:hypothetical protein